MRPFVSLLLFFCLISCSSKKNKEYGAVTGNVFFKDYNFINRPDAGSRVRLISYEDSNLVYTAKTDIRGDFRISQVVEGSYLQIIQSDNARSTYFNLISKISQYKSLIQMIFSEKIDTSFYIYFTKAHYYDSLFFLSSRNIDTDGGLKNYKATAALEDTCEYFAEKAMNSVSQNIKYNLGIVLPYMIDLRPVHLKRDQSENSIINFGVGHYKL